MRVDLGPARDLAHRLGDPQRTFRAVHVAGSKGKGSTALLIAEGLRRAGWTTGLYTSPHVESIRERIRVDGMPIGAEDLELALTQVLDVREEAGRAGSPGGRATWFDVLTLAACVHFRDRGLSLAVFECGLGGRLDSTNLVEALLVVVTALEREHTAILGDTIEAIAGEKAGIMASGVPGVAADARSGSPAGAALRAAAERLATSLWDVPGARGGRLEARNLALARAALVRLGTGGSGLLARDGRPVGAHLLEGGELPRLPGRLEMRRQAGVTVVLDGAHVPASLTAVLNDLAQGEGSSGPLQCVFGCGKDKDALGLLKALAPCADRTLCTRAGAGPYATPSELAALGSSLGMVAEAVDDALQALNDALKTARAAGGWVLVTGSLHLVGALRSKL